MIVSVVSLGLLCPTFSSGEEYRRLEGAYRIGSKQVLDPPPGEKMDRVYFWLEGETAREVYDAMPVKPILNYCGNEDMQAKEAGDLLCVSHKGGRVNCSLAVTLDRGRTAEGSVC